MSAGNKLFPRELRMWLVSMLSAVGIITLSLGTPFGFGACLTINVGMVMFFTYLHMPAPLVPLAAVLIPYAVLVAAMRIVLEYLIHKGIIPSRAS